MKTRWSCNYPAAQARLRATRRAPATLAKRGLTPFAGAFHRARA
jgi:hypothetical protein